jgi:hypothetical protein
MSNIATSDICAKYGPLVVAGHVCWLRPRHAPLARSMISGITLIHVGRERPQRPNTYNIEVFCRSLYSGDLFSMSRAMKLPPIRTATYYLPFTE